MDVLNDAESRRHPFTILITSAVLVFVYTITQIIYRLYFHPLRNVPGPWINAVSRAPQIYHLLAGTTVRNVQHLHNKYGDVVRLSPNEIDFTAGDTAWQEIYGFRTGSMKGHLNMQKDLAWYASPPGAPLSILIANDENHSRYRKSLSHAFSEKALRSQEKLIQSYVDILITQLKASLLETAGPQDMAKWYNWTTFDIIADLIFGEPFGCLRDRKTNEFINLIFNSLMSFRLHYIMTYWPSVKYVFKLLPTQNEILEKRKVYFAWLQTQVKTRVNRNTDRPDFMTEILKHKDEETEMTMGEMTSNAQLLLGAGSETTATLLSGATYLLLKNPDALMKLTEELRGRFKTYDEITMQEVNNTPYLIAVLQESLRYFPPVPTGFQRRVARGGEIISGYYIPEDTALSVSNYPTAHSEKYFKDSEKFIPERWLADPRYADDKKSAIQPFSFGPRNCLGKNLAYAEMRLILAKIMWSFDMELDASSRDWLARCKVFTVWHRPPLYVNLKEAVRG